MSPSSFLIGTAGWALPAKVRDRFPEGASNLARYAGRLQCVEINSSFYRSHKPETYAAWAAATPADFRFSLKCPKTTTHQRRLADCGDFIATFAEETAALGRKRAFVLVQLPPSLQFNRSLIERFFEQLRVRFSCAIACEPRHASWAGDEADALLKALKVTRVAADPPRFERDAEPGGSRSLSYYRLHGSPRLYFGDYDDGRLEALAERLAADKARNHWVIFDNTASGAAAANALRLSEMRQIAAVDR